MDEIYDIAIVGTGPAGISAAINGKIRNKKIVLFGQKDLSQKLTKAPKVNNFVGFYDVTGEELKDKFKAHLDAMNIEINTDRINAVYSMGTHFTLMSNDKQYDAKTVILATGIEFSKPMSGEMEYLGKGVGYCATCDAPLYKGKIVTIIGYNEKAAEEARYVNELAGKTYYIPMHKEKYSMNANINIIEDQPTKVEGSNKVEKLVMKNGQIETDAIFILKDSISPEQLVPGLELENNHIKVNRDMETNIPGLYAAGDCIGAPYQYIKASGEGQVAALNAVSYIDSKK